MDVKKRADVNHSIYQVVAPSRPSHPIFPALTDLTFRCGPPSSTAAAAFHFLLGPNLRKVRIVAKTETVLGSSLPYLSTRCPTLKELVISSDTPGASLMRCVRGLPLLEKLRCNPNDAASEVLAVALTLPNLQELALTTCWGAHIVGSPLQQPAFHSLSVLSLWTSVERWTALLKTGHLPSSIVELNVYGGSTNAKTNSSITKLFEAMAVAIPRIVRLTLRFHSLTTSPITFDNILPLLTCNHLTRLALRHPRGVDITADHISQLLTAFPKLDKLALSYTQSPEGPTGRAFKVQWTPPTLPITVLETIAALRPSMHVLTLCVHADIPNGAANPLSRPGSLSKLEHLNLGYSTVNNPQEVALYLVDRVPSQISWDWISNGAQDSEKLRRAEAKWKEVASLFAILHRQRAALKQQFSMEIEKVKSELAQENRGLP